MLFLGENLSFSHTLNTYLVSTCYVADTGGVTLREKMASLPSWIIQSNVRDRH